MTHAHLPPEDAFDRWLDDLAEGSRDPADDDVSDTATWLHRQVGLAPAKTHRLDNRHKAALRQRIMPRPASHPKSPHSSGSTGIIASAPAVAPARLDGIGWRVIGLVSAAILVIMALTSIGVVLRLDHSERVPSGAATASLMPFAPSSVLASATPAAVCATGDTLVLMPESEPDAATFDDLAFPVAWYQDGILTVEQGGDVIREIEIGPAGRIQPTSWPDVLFVSNDAEDRHGALVNVRSGEVAELGPVFDRQWTNGAYLIWASDASHYTRHIIDLRNFERVDLNQRFRIEPMQSWRPSVPAGNSSNDGTVVLIETPLVPSFEHVSPAAPAATPDLPALEAGTRSILVDGDLNHLSLVEPVSRSSGDTALSPNGKLMAWLAPSDTNPHEERILTIAETATGDVIGTRPVEATYANSLMFSHDGSTIYSTSNTSLEQFVFAPNMATPVAASQPIPLPEPGYSIVAASPDRSKLLLSISEHAPSEILYWTDLDTGTLSEINGAVGRMWKSTFPNTVAPRVSRYFLIDDLTQEVGILDMMTGEIVLTIDRTEGAAATTISPDGHTLMIPSETGVEIVNLRTGVAIAHSAPGETESLPQPASVSSDGSCVAVTWRLDGGDGESVLLSTTSNTVITLSPSTVGGWISSTETSSRATPAP